MKVAIIPSNQHQNTYTGMPGVTEERWALAVCDALAAGLRKYGATTCIFHVPGAGTASTDELSIMLRKAIEWKADYWVSVHSDFVGDKTQTGILMLMPSEATRSEGKALGQAIAQAVGLPYKGTWVYGVEERKIMYLRYLLERGIRGCLVEVGEHGTAAEAKWNWENRTKIGAGIADALAAHLDLIPKEATLEVGTPVDNPMGPTADAAKQRLEDKQVIQPGHPMHAAVGAALFYIVVGRLLERIEALEAQLQGKGDQ